MAQTFMASSTGAIPIRPAQSATTHVTTAQ
jgi:hypothetical protein